MPLTPPDAPAPCPFMARLIALLGDMPAGRNSRRAAAVAERLDRLDRDARHDAAPETTLAAIKGARVLLTLAELPPLTIVSTGADR